MHVASSLRAGRTVRHFLAIVGVTSLGVPAGVFLGACARGTGDVLPPVTQTTVPQTTVPQKTTTVSQTTVPQKTTTTTAPAATTATAPLLELDSTGPAVLSLQQRLEALHYWLGSPDGVFGDSTQQAVYALQKAAGIARDGVVGPATDAALARGVVPRPEPAQGYLIEVDLADDLVMFVTSGALKWTLNTSTGRGLRTVLQHPHKCERTGVRFST